MHRILYLLSGVVFLASSQQVAQQPVFRATTRLIQVNVVALDKKGKPVADLKKEEFTLLDRGKRQLISLFSMETKADRKPVPTLAPGLFTNYTGGTAAPNLTVILIDSLNTQWGDQAQARQKIVKFLQQIKPSDRISLMVLGRQLKVLHGFTDDRESLLKAVRQWSGRQESGGVDSPEFALSDEAQRILYASLEGIFNGPNMSEQDFSQIQRIELSLAAIEGVGNYLAGTPGRKNLIWVSGGFPLQVGFNMGAPPPILSSASSRTAPTTVPLPPQSGPMPGHEQRTFGDEVAKTMKVLNNANVALYPVDARGLTVDTNANENIFTMEEFAVRTGGKAFFNRNDLDTAIREILEETEVTYTLAFYPTSEKPDDKLHDLTVKVSRPGVSVRSRKGYMMSRPEESERSRGQQLAYMAASPLEATGLELLVKVEKKDARLQVQILLDPNTVTMDHEKDKDGKDHWTARLDILLLQRDKAGIELEPTKDTLELNLQRETYAKLIRGGLIYNKNIAAHPKAVFIRIVVRDATSTLAGSVTAKL